jgi:hypothetical protein
MEVSRLQLMTITSRNLRTLELTSREVSLLLKYSCPFPEEEQRLRDSRAVKGYHRVSIDTYCALRCASRSAREALRAVTPISQPLSGLHLALFDSLVHGSSRPPLVHWWPSRECRGVGGLRRRSRRDRSAPMPG